MGFKVRRQRGCEEAGQAPQNQWESRSAESCGGSGVGVSVVGTGVGWGCGFRDKSGVTTPESWRGGGVIPKRLRRRSPLSKTTEYRGELTFGDPLLDYGV